MLPDGSFAPCERYRDDSVWRDECQRFDSGDGLQNVCLDPPYSDSRVYCRMPTGFGGNIPLVASLDDQPAEQTLAFSYAPPVVIQAAN